MLKIISHRGRDADVTRGEVEEEFERWEKDHPKAEIKMMSTSEAAVQTFVIADGVEKGAEIGFTPGSRHYLFTLTFIFTEPQ